MTPRTITIFRLYQLSSHRTLGFFTGDEEAVAKFCSLKYDVEMDDIALERVPVRKITKSEVMCFTEILEQMKTYKEKMDRLEKEADRAGMQEDVVEILEPGKCNDIM